MTSKRALDICNICRTRNPKSHNVAFRQNHSTGFIERWLEYIFILGCLQEFVNYADVLPALALLTSHSLVLILLSNDNCDSNGVGLGNLIVL